MSTLRPPVARPQACPADAGVYAVDVRPAELLLGDVGKPGRRGQRRLTLEVQVCRHHTSGPPPCHSMTGESATSISSISAQPARRMISAKPRRLHAAPTDSPSTRTWRPSPLTGGQTITERSVIRQASPAATPRASGRSLRCRARRCAAPGGVQVHLNTRTKLALDTFAEAAADLINARCPGRGSSSASRTCSVSSGTCPSGDLHATSPPTGHPVAVRTRRLLPTPRPGVLQHHKIKYRELRSVVGRSAGRGLPLSERAPCAARASMHRPTQSAVPVRVLRPRLAPGRTAVPR